jgi:hypothetical protein
VLKAGALLEVAYALAAVSLARWILILTGRVAYLLGANFFLGSAAAVATMSALGRVNRLTMQDQRADRTADIVNRSVAGSRGGSRPIALIEHMLKSAPLAGFVVEGLTPYGGNVSNARHRLMLRAVHSGLPVVRVGRGNTEGFVPLHDPSFIGGSNLTATKARLLLMACLMKFGSLPPAANPDHPTSAESAAVREKVAEYQAVFSTH